MLHRTQDVALPREYAGVWKEPQDMTRIMRALIPSSLEVQARPHAALGLARYTPMTSPLRRYPDLINEAQLLHWLTHGTPRWDGEALSTLLVSLNAVLDAAGQVQRFRPRYWKLLYFRQQGDKVWWDGVVTEENDMFVNVSLPAQGMYVRGKRRMFDERTCPGMAVQVRIGRVHPLYNEIQILEAVKMEAPKTKQVIALTEALKVADKKVLLVLPETNVNLQLSCRNIPSIKPVLAQNVCTYDLMNASAVVMVEGAENVLNVMLA